MYTTVPTIGVKRVGAMSLVSGFGISIETGLSVWDVEETKGKKSIALLCFTLRADSVATPFFLSFFLQKRKQVGLDSLTHARVLRFLYPICFGRLLVRCISSTHFVVKCLYAREMSFYSRFSLVSVVFCYFLEFVCFLRKCSQFLSSHT
jgi:hypothetical protein